MTFLEKYPGALGLGDDEGTVYGFLEREGESPAKVVADRCQIPFSRIHKVLFNLQEKELVISRGEAPKTFALRYKDPELLKQIKAAVPKHDKRE